MVFVYLFTLYPPYRVYKIILIRPPRGFECFCGLLGDERGTNLGAAVDHPRVSRARRKIPDQREDREENDDGDNELSHDLLPE